jgi:glutamate synthase (NADPH/NADH) small chain
MTAPDSPNLKPAQRMRIRRQEMPEREARARQSNFDEVNLGLPLELAVLEARRCLECKDPKCVSGCPVQIDIPGFIAALANRNLPAAADILFQQNPLPGITGRVCPQERQCECLCVRCHKGDPVAIGYLERFVADWARTQTAASSRTGNCQPATDNPSQIAIIGAGPAGLTAAGDLARLGHRVTIFEALHEPGGVLQYGIPEFRLPKQIVRDEIQTLTRLGVKIECNVVIGRTYTIDELMTEMGFGAIFIANGAGLPLFLGIPGENLKGVYSANEFLTRINLMGAYNPEAETPVLRPRKAVVIGGGNVALDAVRTARRLGADPATLVYRRSRAEMPARAEEIHHAEQESIILQLLTNPLAVIGDENGWVKALRCQKMELGEPDESGRRSPVPVPDSEFDIECDAVIEAIGTRANPLLTATTPDLKLNKRGNIEVDATGMTSKPGVFAGGDIVRGAATVILAMGDGKRAASAIHQYLRCRPRPTCNCATPPNPKT